MNLATPAPRVKLTAFILPIIILTAITIAACTPDQSGPSADDRNPYWNSTGSIIRLLDPDGRQVHEVERDSDAWPATDDPRAQGAAALEIAQVEERNDFVVIRNADTAAVDLAGWTLRDQKGNLLTVAEAHLLMPGESVRIYPAALLPGAPANSIAVSESPAVSSCPDTIDTPAGAPYTVSTIWCAQRYLDDFSISEDFRNSTAGLIEETVAEFEQNADLSVEDIIMLEITFSNEDAGGTEIALSGPDSALKLVLKDGTAAEPTAWVSVNDPVRDLETIGDGPLSDFFTQLGGRLIAGETISQVAEDLVPMTDPLTVTEDIRIWVPWIFAINNPAEAIDYNGTRIPLNYSLLD